MKRQLKLNTTVLPGIIAVVVLLALIILVTIDIKGLIHKECKEDGKEFNSSIVGDYKTIDYSLPGPINKKQVGIIK